jgi:hypothetical protein
MSVGRGDGGVRLNYGRKPEGRRTIIDGAPHNRIRSWEHTEKGALKVPKDLKRTARKLRGGFRLP